MPHSTCPACSSNQVKHLQELSKEAHVDYYRCRACAHVWSLTKSNPDGEAHHVTPLPGAACIPVQDLRPGDFTVTPVPGGFMVGQMIPRLGLGPWWTFIKIVRDEDDAVRLAVTGAVGDHTRVWRQEAPDTFRLVVPNSNR